MTPVDPKELGKLKEELTTELENVELDVTHILQITNRIAALDKSRVRFTTDAAVIRRLGRELVGRQETALAELIKNAYDADAQSVDIRFLLSGDELLGIEVRDFGNGMTRSELVDGFMRLASNQKVREPRSPLYNRRRAGRKGIGRFASERLGDVLVLTTRTRGAPMALRITIEWKDFAQGVNLNEIETSVSEIEWDQPHGTMLEILDPRDTWGKTQIDRVFKAVSALLQPFKALAPAARGESDPGFLVTFYRQDFVKGRDVTAADINSEIFQHAFAFVEASIEDDGRVNWSLSSTRYKILPEMVPFISEKGGATTLPSARNAQLRAYYYINRPDLYPAMTYGMLRPQLEAHGGVRLYRNGFRVLPYGEPEDDWLQLDELESRRIHSNVSLANRNFLGSVEIDDLEGLRFEETSSREGLIENTAFTEMRDTFSAVLVSAARAITAIRLKEAGGSSLRHPRTEDVLHDAQEAATRLSQEDPSNAVDRDDGRGKTEGAPAGQERRDDLERISAGLAEAQRLVQERAMLRTLASLGLTVAEFTHEIKHQSQFIDLTLDQLMRLAPDGPIAEKCAELVKRVDSSRDFSAYFGDMVSERASRQRVPVQLYLMAREFRDGVEPMLASPPIEVVVERPGSYDIFTTPMYRAEWASILMNLLTNSLKAIRRRRVTGHILIRTGFLEDGQVFLEFCDNGDGIPIQNRERVFDAFFSTSGAAPAGAADFRHELGSGLGLKIVHDIINAVSGEIRVIDPPEGFSTCIRVSVPAAAAEEIEHD